MDSSRNLRVKTAINKSFAKQIDLQVAIILSECNKQSFDACVTEIFICILPGTAVALWRQLRNDDWEVSWKLVHCCVVHRRPMINASYSSACRHIRICSSYWTIHRSLEIILERELSIYWNSYLSNALCKSIASRKIQCDMNHFLNYLIPDVSSGCNEWARVKRQRTPTTNRTVARKSSVGGLDILKIW